MPTSRKPSAAERAKLQAMDKQFSALRAESYRLTLMDSTGEKPPINLGKEKGPGGEEKFYTSEEIKRKVGLLSAKNADGYNIYITPIDSQKHYMVIDDLDSDKLRQFQDWGYRPALVQKSSHDSIQAVSILQKSDVSHGAGNALFKKLNRRVGDPNISGFVHPFRLAGFGNKKPSRRLENGKSPFVTLVHTRLGVDEKATLEARAIDDEVKTDARQARASRIPNVAVTREETGACDVAAARSWYKRRVDFWDDRADLSRIDRQLARRLRNQGYSLAAAVAIIKSVSPGLAARHPRIDEYVASKVADLWSAPVELQDQTVSNAVAEPRPK